METTAPPNSTDSRQREIQDCVARELASMYGWNRFKGQEMVNAMHQLQGMSGGSEDLEDSKQQADMSTGHGAVEAEHEQRDFGGGSPLSSLDSNLLNDQERGLLRDCEVRQPRLIETQLSHAGYMVFQHDDGQPTQGQPTVDVTMAEQDVDERLADEQQSDTRLVYLPNPSAYLRHGQPIAAQSVDTEMEYKEEAPTQEEYVDAQESSSASDASDIESDEAVYDDTLLSYARHYGISVDYLSESPLDRRHLPTPPEYTWQDFNDPVEVLSVETLVVQAALSGHTTKERWDVDRETIEYLNSVMDLSKEPAGEDVESMPVVKAKDLKVEQPILRTDVEMDMLRVRRRNELRISSEGMKPFGLKNDEDEGPGWPSSYLRLPAIKDKEVHDERLEVSKETVDFLRSCAMPPDVAFDAAEMAQQDHERQKARTVRPITPTLLPISPPYSPKVTPVARHLDYTSTPEDPNPNELRRLDNQIMASDAPGEQAAYAQFTDLSQIYSPLKTYADEQSSSSAPRAKRKRVHDLKVETPLTPLNVRKSPNKRTKSVSLPEHLHEYIPAPDPMSTDPAQDTTAAKRDFANAVLAEIRPLADPAIQLVNGEKLIEADTTMRMPVPEIDKSMPVPPWKQYTEQWAWISMIKKEVLRDEGKWRGVSKLERLLGWSPFPTYLGKVNIDEQFDDGSLARYMVEMTFADATDTDSLVWKPDGLRVLDDEDDENEQLGMTEWEEIDKEIVAESEPRAMKAADTVKPRHIPQLLLPPNLGEISGRPQIARAGGKPVTEPNTASDHTPEPTRLDMATLLRKRQLELEANTVSTESDQKKSKTCSSTLAENRSPVEKRTAGTVASRPTTVVREDDMLDNFAAGNALNRFLQLHAGALTAVPLPKTSKPPVVQEAAPTAVMIAPGQQTEGAANTQISTKPANPLPIPEMVAIHGPLPVIVSSSILMQRNLIRQLQSAIPSLDLCERDLGSPDGKASQAMEADIMMSPGTGLIMTSLQKLKQKPLPGRTSFFGIQGRIAAVAPRYERLIILVTESNIANAGDSRLQGLDETDCAALSDLVGFTSVLDTIVQVTFVLGGESELAIWIASSIARYRSQSDIKLLPDETLWELFLRKAGLNAYAAQAILAQVKIPEQHEVHSSSSGHLSSIPSSYGLAAFVRMSAQERVARFGALLGGERVLTRVSAAIDAGWMSAADRA